MNIALATPMDTPIALQWLENGKAQKSVLEPPDKERPHLCYIVRLDDGHAVGWVDVFNIDMMNQKAEVGIVIPDRRGRGISQRLGKKVLQIAFDDLLLNRVTIRIKETNTQAMRMAEMFGLTKEGVERGAHFNGEEYEDIHVFGFTAADYSEVK